MLKIMEYDSVHCSYEIYNHGNSHLKKTKSVDNSKEWQYISNYINFSWYCGIFFGLK